MVAIWHLGRMAQTETITAHRLRQGFISSAHGKLMPNSRTNPPHVHLHPPHGPANATACILQESANLASLIDSPRVPLVVGNENQVTTSGYADKKLFFRLTLPTPPVGLASQSIVPTPLLAAPLNTSSGT